ncbi:IS630 family transposase [Streptomyces sp. NPDC127066]|uniref:IS630 family transposase n=1 Tax=Streptomyces sp. NPDC127066 TaxID=3347125 RepID=UPI003656611F
MEEGRKPQRISRTAKDPVKLRRAIVVLMSAQGQTVKDITVLLQGGEDYVRDVIHAFNERGFDALDPKWSGGHPGTISDQVREHICLIARTSPADWKITAFSAWSLSKLADHLVKQKVTGAVSRETLRRILQEGKVSWKTTTTWKASTDPEFIAKTRRVLALYDTPPAGGRVICVDEFGPLNLMPRKGKAWGPMRRPRRLRATSNRYDGVRQMLAALDLATGKPYYRIRPRKRWREFLDLLKALRARWPGQKLYVVLDSFSPHKHAKVRTWATDNDIELVFLPACGSWLNWIEAEFAALRYFALNGTDHRSHDEQNAAIAAYVRRRNTHAEPKTNFAPDSPVRSWTDRPAKAA